jgi:hypothetical protein
MLKTALFPCLFQKNRFILLIGNLKKNDKRTHSILIIKRAMRSLRVRYEIPPPFGKKHYILILFSIDCWH